MILGPMVWRDAGLWGLGDDAARAGETESQASGALPGGMELMHLHDNQRQVSGTSG